MLAWVDGYFFLIYYTYIPNNKIARPSCITTLIRCLPLFLCLFFSVSHLHHKLLPVLVSNWIELWSSFSQPIPDAIYAFLEICYKIVLITTSTLRDTFSIRESQVVGHSVLPWIMILQLNRSELHLWMCHEVEWVHIQCVQCYCCWLLVLLPWYWRLMWCCVVVVGAIVHLLLRYTTMVDLSSWFSIHSYVFVWASLFQFQNLEWSSN